MRIPAQGSKEERGRMNRNRRPERTKTESKGEQNKIHGVKVK